MTTVTTTAGDTLIALMSAIKNVANAAAKTVDTAASTIDMVDNYVQDAKHKQVINTSVINDDWLNNLLDEAALEREKREAKIVAHYANNKVGQENFNRIRAQLEAKFNSAKPNP